MTITATSSRRTFVFQCVNPRCRTTYVRTLGIAGDVAAVFSDVASRRELMLRSFKAGRRAPDAGTFE